MKLKKKFLILSFMILLFIIIFIIYILIRPKSYSMTYKKSGYEINENYNQKTQMYYLQINDNDKVYEFSLLSDYEGKKVVDKVLSYESDKYNCLKIKSEKINLYPSCYREDEPISYSIINEEGFEQFYLSDNPQFINEEFNNIKIYASLDKNFAIWDNKGFIFISEKKRKKIDFLEDEIYYDTMSYALSHYLLIPDYDQKYSFDKYYIFNIKNGKVTEWYLDYKISFNSYYLGNINNKIYLLDRKNNKELEINPQKKKIKIVSKDSYGKVWNNKWESISMVKLLNNDYHFNIDELYKYDLSNGKLRVSISDSDIKALITDKIVDKIVYTNKDEVCYLVGDKLYYHSNLYGEVLMLTYNEWNFNQQNPIYIY